jgi:UDP:flavonoid glycosyltransferase YjiC (YdhE family)
VRTGRPRILLVGEAATLAHVVRPLELARRMPEQEWDVVFACDERYAHIARRAGLSYYPLRSIPTQVFLTRVHNAEMLYKPAELEGYVKEELELFERIRPDVVVGDFRLSLSISSHAAGIPSVAMSNVHWSPNLRLPVPVPEHPIVTVLGVRLARIVLVAALPVFWWVQTPGINRLRRKYGLPPLKTAQQVFTQGTRTVYMDVPELYDVETLSETESCIGPVNWSPAIPLPEWWSEVREDRPIAFVTPGSSGRVETTAEIATALASAGLEVMVATAGRCEIPPGTPGVHAADYLPAPEACERADLVVCNGGAMVYQALAKGRPVLGIPCNIDQYYTMEAVVRKGAGLVVRSGSITRESVRTAARDLLRHSSFSARAESLATCIARLDPVSGLSQVLHRFKGSESLKSAPVPLR